MIRSKKFLVIGGLLVLIAVLGFLTVADELVHVGEIVGVGSILLSGLVLIIAGLDNPVSRSLELQWLAPALLGGAMLGAAMDNMYLGVGIGGVFGMALIIGRAKLRLSRPSGIAV